MQGPKGPYTRPAPDTIPAIALPAHFRVMRIRDRRDEGEMSDDGALPVGVGTVEQRRGNWKTVTTVRIPLTWSRGSPAKSATDSAKPDLSGTHCAPFKVLRSRTDNRPMRWRGRLTPGGEDQT